MEFVQDCVLDCDLVSLFGMTMVSSQNQKSPCLSSGLVLLLFLNQRSVWYPSIIFLSKFENTRGGAGGK